MVEADSIEEFAERFDEGRIAAALPGEMAYLAAIKERPTVSQSLLARWKKLRRASGS
jgi:hypothetical protein